MRTLMHWALTPLVVLVLAGCGGGDDKKAEGAPAEPTSRTLAATVTADDGYDTLQGVITNAGLSAVLEGKGPYTLFAPADAAFTAAADDSDFTSEALRAEAAALLRAHIVPGALTRSDIAAAIERAGAEGVEMRTMADTLLTFTRDGQAIVVTTPDGARARLTGEEQLAANGVLQPVDGLLVKAATPAA